MVAEEDYDWEGAFDNLFSNAYAQKETLNYEDKIVRDEVKRKMDSLVSKLQKKGVSVENFKFNDEDLQVMEQLADLNNIEVIKGNWSGITDEQTGAQSVNVPLEPTLFNLFVMAEEAAHLDYPKHARRYKENEMYSKLSDAEDYYLEEMRAKKEALEYTGGQLPKGQRTVDITKSEYGRDFLDVIMQEDLETQKFYLNKYPELRELMKIEYPEGYAEGGTVATDDEYTGFRYIGTTAVDPAKYSSTFINYYNMALGLPTLSEETGIDVDEGEDITQLATPGQDLDRGRDVGMTPSQVESIMSTANFNPSYSGTIGEAKTDRVSFVDDITAPFKEAGNIISKTIQDTFSKAPTATDVAIAGGTAVAGEIGVPMAPVLGGVLGPAMAGRTKKDAFGNVTVDASGIPGFVQTLVGNLQAKDRAAIAAAKAVPGATVTGFEVNWGIGKNGITRAPGSGTYTGNMMGLSQTQMKAIEAIQKGFEPRTYNMQDETGTKFAASGGMKVGNLGYYTGNGSFVSITGQGSRYGLMSHAETLAKENGITTQQALDALTTARTTDTTLKQAVDSQKSQTSIGQQKAEETRMQKESQPDISKEQGPESKVSSDYSARPDRQGPGGGRDVSGAAGGATGGAGKQGQGSGWGGMARGGRVGLQAGGVAGQMAGQSGFVDQPPSQVPEGETVADNVETKLPEGAFVINAAAVEFAGEQDIKKMLLDAHGEAVRRGLTVDKQGNGAKMIDVAISRGEVVVSPHLTKIIGLDRLQKINNRGKRETQERIEENGQEPTGAAQGMLIMGRGDNTSLDVSPPTGFEEGTLDKGFLGSPPEYQPPADVGEDVPMEEVVELPEDFANRLEQHFGQGVSRTRNDKFYRSLSEQELLAHLIVAETKAAGADPDDMYAVGQTVINRINSDRPEFKNKKTVADVALSRLQKGGYEYTGMDVTRNKAIKEEFKSTPENIRKGYARAYVIAGDLLSGEMEASPIVGPDIMWYTRKDAQNKWMQENLDFVDTYGLHDFYKAPK
jgi:hypothetical protein